jgi:hypothetical protein
MTTTRLPRLTRTFKDARAAAKAIGKHLGITGGPGGQLYVRAADGTLGIAFIHGWDKYAKQLAANGDILPATDAPYPAVRVVAANIEERVRWRAENVARLAAEGAAR